MSLIVVDYLFDLFLSEILPNANNIIIICNDKCMIHDSFLVKYTIISSIDHLNKGGSFILKVASEIQRGFIFSLLISKYPVSYIFTPRKDIISLYLPSCRLQDLRTPSKQSQAKIQNFAQNEPIISSPSVVSSQNSQASSQIKPQLSLYDQVYTESLNKYYETILSTPIKATKLKSARAQLRNIVDGVITSVKKKTGLQDICESEELTDAIITDLSDYSIINLSSMVIDYNEEEIEAYFGWKKNKNFIPRHKNGGNKPKRQEEVKRPPFSEDLLEIVQAITKQSAQDDLLWNIATIGELTHLLKSTLNKFCNNNNRQFTEAQSNQINSQVLKRVLEAKFMINDIKNLDEVCVAPNKFFFIKLQLRR
ncbi:hypothetical protein SteCoe_38771 [Stentor coeruleus]|uniref:Uncharacterized protein n=1 Tax=Stentor coeruleus TaxID=5963 RepID=A0A1R2AL31_9CILI|nr:hypothetical protein SteCoe_38771 [Stentor coeruleus]